jgi:hypothetical protein
MAEVSSVNLLAKTACPDGSGLFEQSCIVSLDSPLNIGSVFEEAIKAVHKHLELSTQLKPVNRCPQNNSVITLHFLPQPICVVLKTVL